MVMTGSVVLCLFFCVIYVPAHGDNMIGPGQWNVLFAKKCPDNPSYIFECEIEMRKINRTHSGFNVIMKLGDTVDETFAIRIEVCKRVDGGCKPYQVLTDDSIVNFAYKYTNDNVNKFLSLGGIESPYFPLQKGEFSVTNFIINLDDLPINGIYGQYVSKIYILKDFVKLGCIDVASDFVEKQDGDGEYEDE